ncbi:histidine triad nucleotide-binding protein [Saccharophagus sp. K07]|uniref:histidine triad nucleotide-binding protein n=1 Tax=Saccharophagus sp. K07 TaxID=2283636 RepID=UPI0016522100|nr:histidine triad nucleotide-binding protein [Saccharophagus sp. K07]MBC6904733.1 histidine triad nucleotide-binding protein [Saccharophagus sp. K07]
MAERSIFSRIIDGEIPTEFVYQDDLCVCIRDIAPQAPTHLLIIPRKSIPKLVDATAEDQALLGHLMVKAGEIARQLGVGDAFRLVINNGAGAGQTVFHLHIHLLANKTFKEGSLGF